MMNVFHELCGTSPVGEAIRQRGHSCGSGNASLANGDTNAIQSTWKEETKITCPSNPLGHSVAEKAWAGKAIGEHIMNGMKVRS